MMRALERAAAVFCTACICAELLSRFVGQGWGQKCIKAVAGREDEFVIDSAGILSYHQGELPDSRMCAHAARRGYNLTHRSRPVRTDDFYNFDLIIGMDDRNIDDLKERAPSLKPLMISCHFLIHSSPLPLLS